jgi:FAD-dependent urate hydroxylase
MDVIIAGAGIGGLALARGLLRDGQHRVRVFEEAPALREGGAAVTIFTNGSAALAGLGVPLNGLGGQIDVLEIRTGAGKRVAHSALSDVRTVPRYPLIKRLAETVDIRFGAGITGVTVHPGQIEVLDAQGNTHTGDVLVGADGQRSVVRRVTLSPEPAKPSGWATWQGLTESLPQIASGAIGVCLVGEAGLCGLMPAGEGLTQWWFSVRQSLPVDDPADWLRQRFARFADPVPRLLAGLASEEIGYFPHATHEVLPHWGSGRSTLLGDAAHAFPPSQAQGANQALEDAWLLNRALGTPGEPAALLRRYEALRVPRVSKVSRMATAETTSKPAGPLARLLAPLVPAKVAGAGYLRLIKSWSSVLNGERP